MLRGARSTAAKEGDGDEHIEEKIHSLAVRLASVESELLHLLNVINMLACRRSVPNTTGLKVKECV